MKRVLKSPARVPEAPSQGRPVLLVVVDDEGVRAALHLILDDDYAVLDAAHGRAALDTVGSQRVDLVLLDILLPGIDGLEILQELKARDPNLPVVMMTAVKTVRSAVAAMKLGAADYLTKPFQEEELLAIIRSVLEKQRGQRSTHPKRAREAIGGRPPRPHRLLLVDTDLGRRAALAVTLERVAEVETAPWTVEGLNRVLSFRPTCVVLNVGQTSTDAARFLGALYAQLPACPVLVVSDEAHLDAPLIGEMFNIRGVMRPPVDPGELVRQLEAVLAPRGDAGAPWPQLSHPVSRTIEYVSAHFGEALTVEGVAGTVGVSGSHLAHLFHAETGVTVHDYLTKVRVEIAKNLLSCTDEKLTPIAARVGFFDASHFSRVFRRTTGTSPKTYRRSSSGR